MRSVWSKGRDISQAQGKQCLSDEVPSTFKFHARAVDASKSHQSKLSTLTIQYRTTPDPTLSNLRLWIDNGILGLSK